MLCTLHHTLFGDQIKKLGQARHVARTGKRRGAYKVLVGKLTEGDHSDEADVDGRIILKWIFEKWVEGMDCIDLAQDRKRWRALVDAVMNICVP